MKQKFVIPLANGSEEIETVVTADTLRRAGLEVVLAGLEEELTRASRDVRIAPDTDWRNIDPDEFSGIILPGGMDGAKRLASNSKLLDALEKFERSGKWVAAICAAPLVLERAGILKNHRFTCYPGIEKMIGRPEDRSDERVVVCGRVITSQGPGTAFDFALKLIELVAGAERESEVRKALLLN